MLPLSISSALALPLGHPAAAYVFFLVFPSLTYFLLSFNNAFQKPVPTQDVTNPISLPSVCM